MSTRPILYLALLAACSVAGCRPAVAPSPGEARVTRGPFRATVACEGTVEAQRMETVLSRFQGRATLVELVPEGTEVRPGDILARLDTSQLESDVVKLRNALTRAETALDALRYADIPLERQDLAVQLGDLQYQFDSEQQILADTRELADRQLVSRHEVEQQEARLANLAAKRNQLEQRRALIEQHAHPAKLAQAEADVEAARQQLDQVNQQLSNCVVTAPAAGLVVYLPLHIGGEYRPVRVGDTLYPNQPFLCVPDLRVLTVQAFIPEAELARVELGQKADITPLAFPDSRLPGTVESLGGMAQTRPGYPAWQRFLRVIIRLDQGEARLRPGMSAHIDIVSAERTEATLIPRSAVRWENGTPTCTVHTPQGLAIRPLTLGAGNEQSFDVRAGVVPGDVVVLP